MLNLLLHLFFNFKTFSAWIDDENPKTYLEVFLNTNFFETLGSITFERLWNPITLYIMKRNLVQKFQVKFANNKQMDGWANGRNLINRTLLVMWHPKIYLISKGLIAGVRIQPWGTPTLLEIHFS